MSPDQTFVSILRGAEPWLALAPMQDVTDLAFWRVIARYGGADVYWTEYFRAHGDSRPERWILDSITQNPTGRPVVAQMIGNDVPSLVRTARELQRYPIAAIDLNLGCPAPVVYRKCAGGGLLREPQKIDAILGALRDAVTIPLTVKTRIGFDSPDSFDDLLALFGRHAIDLLTVHGRTVAQMYRPGVRYDLIARAARSLRCPVLANGNVHGPDQALALLAETGAAGLMIGRGVIRNPWLFTQIRQRRRGEPATLPTGREVLGYIRELWDGQVTSDAPESAQVQRMKKFMNFIGEGVVPPGPFLHDIRRATTREDFFKICERGLDHDRTMTLEPQEIHAPEPACQ
ncbi:MAG TPA: tRNA-dihydrouridine synthase family protein [Verrucomicrobiae bacterium]|jgi:tRNA-dihydrouridine synthase|nr:tRNA-dihydrouridine synthase family protein [Verrucomicrobiae bacterium]